MVMLHQPRKGRGEEIDLRPWHDLIDLDVRREQRALEKKRLIQKRRLDWQFQYELRQIEREN